jgi:hypothetical protein
VAERVAWRVLRSLRAERSETSVVFVDEMGTNTSLSALRACGRDVGQDLLFGASKPGPNTTTLLSSMTVEGMGPSLAVEGDTDREVFEANVEKILTPSLQAEQVVVMDNFSAHKGEGIRTGRGARLQADVPATLLAGP